MKEATGELNITVITIIAIAAVAALFYAFIWPMIKNNIDRSTRCANAFGCSCQAGADTCTCSYYTESNTISSVVCPNTTN